MSEDDRVTRAEALQLLGVAPKSVSSVLLLEQKGKLTRHYIERVSGGKRRRVVVYDRAEVDAVIAERKNEKAQRIEQAASREGDFAAANLSAAYDHRERAAEALRDAFERFKRDTVSEEQARKILDLNAWRFMQLVDSGRVRARRMYALERYEREDVLRESERLERKTAEKK